MSAFDQLAAKLAQQKGVTNPRALAAYIGRKKYSGPIMAKAAARGVSREVGCEETLMPRTQTRNSASPYTEREITQILTAVVAWSGNVNAALKQLREDETVKSAPNPATIYGWIRGKYADLYNSIREQQMESMERELADRYRGVAAQAIEATELGVQVAVETLKSARGPRSRSLRREPRDGRRQDACGATRCSRASRRRSARTAGCQRRCGC